MLSYLSAFMLLWIMQPRLLYKPTHALQTTPASHNVAYEELWIPAVESKQEKLHGWWMPRSKAPFGTLIYFHGAGLNIGYNVTQAFWMRQLGFNVLLLEYRGYGLSGGDFPTERSLYQDAETALRYVTDVQQIPEHEVFVYGHSLGGAIAIDLASKHPTLAGLIVHNSFTTMAEMVARSSYARWFPVQWILTQRFESLAKVAKLEVPMMLIHAEKDPLVPVEMGKRLYRAAKSSSKKLVVVETNLHHNAADVYKNEHHLAKIKYFVMSVLRAG